MTCVVLPFMTREELDKQEQEIDGDVVQIWSARQVRAAVRANKKCVEQERAEKNKMVLRQYRVK